MNIRQMAVFSKKIYIQFILGLFISILIFKSFTVPLYLYEILFGLWVLYISASFSIRLNSRLYILTGITFLASVLGYYIAEIKNWANLIDLMYTALIQSIDVILFYLVGIAITKTIVKVYELIDNYIFSKKEEAFIEQESKLFEERKKDLKRIQDMLKHYNILGIDAKWGQGKTYVTECLKSDYTYVKIDLLSCEVVDIQSYILSQLDKALKKEGIISKYSPLIKKLISQDSLVDKVYNLFMDDDITISEMVDNIKFLIKKSGMHVLLVIEDLDRISDIGRIKTILNLGYNLSSENIKILYHYDKKILKKKKITQRYIEKFIPESITLTVLSFRRILSYVLEHMPENGLVTMDDFSHLHVVTYKKTGKKHIVECEGFVGGRVTIRNVEHFVHSINSILGHYAYYKDYKRQVIAFYFIKIFVAGLYKRFDCYKGILHSFTLYCDEKESTLNNIIQMGIKDNEQLKKILNDFNNKGTLMLLGLFDIDIFKLAAYKKRGNFTKYQSEFSKIDKIQKIIYHLMYEGHPLFTNGENLVNILKKEVLSVPNQKEVNRIFSSLVCKYIFDEIDEYGNSIYKENSPEEFFFNSCYFLDRLTSHEWIKLIKAFCDVRRCEWIDEELLKCFCAIKFVDTEVLLEAIQCFCKFKIVNNFNDEQYFFKFVYTILSQYHQLGLFHLYTIEVLSYTIENIDTEEKVKELQKLLNKDLENIKEYCNKQREYHAGVVNILCVLESFINKIIEIMKCETTLSEYENQIYRSLVDNDDDFYDDPVQNIKQLPKEKQRKELIKLYDSKEITLYKYLEGFKKIDND